MKSVHLVEISTFSGNLSRRLYLRAVGEFIGGHGFDEQQVGYGQNGDINRQGIPGCFG
jgi:hypothetical protein